MVGICEKGHLSVSEVFCKLCESAAIQQLDEVEFKPVVQTTVDVVVVEIISGVWK